MQTSSQSSLRGRGKEQTAPEMQATTNRQVCVPKGWKQPQRAKKSCGRQSSEESEKEEENAINSLRVRAILSMPSQNPLYAGAPYDGRSITHNYGLAILGGRDISRSRPKQANCRGCGLRLSMFSSFCHLFFPGAYCRQKATALFKSDGKIMQTVMAQKDRGIKSKESVPGEGVVVRPMGSWTISRDVPTP